MFTEATASVGMPASGLGRERKAGRHLRREAFAGSEWRQALALSGKRTFDVLSSTGIALCFAPFLPAIALLIKRSSPGPVFFVQERVGYAQRPFRMYKFRTMAQPPPKHDPARWGAEEETRVTPIGRLFRDYGIDELPQVMNIIKGDMSVVGPRPPLPSQAAEYSIAQKKIFDMRPGVLSLAAVRGRRSISVEKRIEYHIQYVRDWNLALDIEILWKCLFVVLKRENANEYIDR